MGLLKTAAKVAVASSVHGKVQRRQQQRWAAQDAASQQMLAPVHPAPVVPARLWLKTQWSLSSNSWLSFVMRAS